MKNRIFITGYYGFANTGDEAILMAMIEHLRELRPGLKITATSATPETTAAAYGIETILWSDTLAMLEAVRSSDLILIGGGGIFHDYWGFDPNAFLTNNHWGISFYTAPAILGALYNKPVMLYAVGIGPLLSEHGKQFTKAACDAATVITVRDEPSKQLLQSLGVDPARVSVTADPAFGFNTTRQDVELPPIPEKPLIGIALRNWDVGIAPAFWEQEIAAGLDLFLADNPGHVLFIPFQRLEGQPEDDLSVAARVRGHMKHSGRATILDAALSPPQLFTVLSRCGLVVGMRLHSLILALLGNVPTLALSYDSKVQQAMQRTGLESFTIDIRAVDAARLAVLMKDALTQRREAVSLGDAARSNARLAVKALDSGAPPAAVSRKGLSLLARGIHAQVRDNQMLRDETRRLFREVEYYRAEHSGTAAKMNGLALQFTNLEAEYHGILSGLEKAVGERQAKAREEAQALNARTEELTASLEKIETELTAIIGALLLEKKDLKTLVHTSEQALRAADGAREKVITELDKFHQFFESTLTGYRNQRAWQIMLLIRKAYTLLHQQGFAAFLKWTLSIPFAGFGSLAEYDLKFPQVWNSMPDTLRQSYVADLGEEEESSEPGLRHSVPL